MNGEGKRGFTPRKENLGLGKKYGVLKILVLRFKQAVVDRLLEPATAWWPVFMAQRSHPRCARRGYQSTSSVKALA